MRLQLRSVIVAAGIAVVLAAPVRAWDVGNDPLKAEIDKLLSTLEKNTNGVVTWDGADPYEVKQDGTASVAVITHARMSVHGKELAQLAFDRIEIRRSPDPADSTMVKYAVALPSESTLTTADGTQVKLTLKDAKANVVVEGQSQRVRETALSLASARVSEATSASSIDFGPLTSSSKLIVDAKGGFAGPAALEWQKIKFSFPEGKVDGAIDRVAYAGNLAGPSLATFDKLRAELEELRQTVSTPEAKMAAVLDVLPAMAAAYSRIQGELEIDGIAVNQEAKSVFALAKASIGSELTGLDGDDAALRITLKHDGLALAPSALPPDKVPQRAVIDLGLENVSTAALRSIIAAAVKMNGSPADKQTAQQQMFAAAATLSPTFKIYDIAGDTKDVGIDITGTATGSPLSHTGYTADSDVLVRGFDAVPTLAAGAPLIDYLPVLKEIGEPGSPTDGAAQVKFHLASTPPKWITINGNDVSAWFIDTGHAPGQTRQLKPAAPPLRGADVTAVQQALAAANVAVNQGGAYDGPTAAAVARFQKQNSLNVNGVVDAPTWQKLGVKAEAAPQGQPAPGSPPQK